MPRIKLCVGEDYVMSKNAENKDIVICKFCTQTYVFPNATRMKSHLKKCCRCPREIKDQCAAEGKICFEDHASLRSGMPANFLRLRIVLVFS